MTKQEEIREGIADFIPKWQLTNSEALHIANSIMEYLHSQGVVIKVDREVIEGCSIVPKTNAVCPYKEASFFEPLQGGD